MIYYFPSLFIIIRGILELIPLTYDKHILSNIIIRSIHSIGCVYYYIPIFINYDINLIDNETNNVPIEVRYVLDRSLNFFIWDIFTLLLSKEKDKLIFILHHFICYLGLSFALYFEVNWYFAGTGLFIGELTNPLTQISEACILFNYYNIHFEKFYFYSMMFTRGIIYPIILMVYVYRLIYMNEINELYFMYKMSSIINLFCMCCLTIGGLEWLYNKNLTFKNNKTQIIKLK